MSNIEIEEEKIEQLTSIISFLESTPGKLLVNMIKETSENRLLELVYSNKDDVFTCQGEVRAYKDILNLLTPETIKVLREQIQ